MWLVLRQLSGPVVKAVLEDGGMFQGDPGDDHGCEALLLRLLGDQAVEKALVLILDVGGVTDLSRGEGQMSTPSPT